MRRLGARYQLVLSDLWGYPSNGWHGRGPPWEDLDGWARTVPPRGALAARAARSSGTCGTSPTTENFWTGTREQFFRVYAVAARALVDELGAGRRGGRAQHHEPRPGVARGPAPALPRAPAAGSSFLSYHANLLPDEPIPAISDAAARVAGARASRATATWACARIEVNESVGPVDQYRPGEILGYLHHMEAGGADAAARSCWPALDGEDNCSNGTLEGLLTPDGQPRSAWWAYRAYAEGAEARVPARSDDPAVAVARQRAAGRRRPQVLLARLDRAAPGAPATRGGARAAAASGARSPGGAHGVRSRRACCRTAASSRSPAPQPS